MRKDTVKKITEGDIAFVAMQIVKEMFTMDVVMSRRISYDAKTNSVIFNDIKYPVDFFTYEEIAENINSKTYEMLKATYRQVEDCGEYFEVSE